MLNPLWQEHQITNRADAILLAAESVLFVGISHQSMLPWPPSSLFCRLVEQCPVKVLEIWQPELDRIGYLRHRNLFLQQGDIHDFDAHGEQGETLVWLHGPEHLHIRDAQALIPDLLSFFGQVVFETPWGVYEQGIIDGNPFQIHRSQWNAGLFETLGMEAVDIQNTDGNWITVAVKQ